MSWELVIGHEHELPHPAWRVWNAVATGAGNRGWLYPMEIEPQVGGTVSRGPATVIEWEPMHRFACRFADAEIGFSNTLTYVLDAVDGDTTMLHTTIHWVHDGDRDAEWDVKADAAQRHVGFYHHSLGQYLDHFADRRPATYVRAAPELPADQPAFPKLLQSLAIPGDATVGDTIRFTPPGSAPHDAVVDYLSSDFVGVRTEDGLYRLFNGARWQWPTWLGHHLFTEGIDGQAATRAWQSWLAQT